MKETIALDLTLILKPIQNKQASNLSDDWLENDDQTLLHSFQKVAAKQIYTVTQIILKQTISGYLLQTSAGYINLETGDVIKVPIEAFEVEIVKKQVVTNPDPNIDEHFFKARGYDDIWDQPSTLRMHEVQDYKINHDPFASKIVPYENQIQDPLDFLYENTSEQRQQHYLGVVPQSTGIGSLSYDPGASLQSPMPTLNIHPQSGYNFSVPSDVILEPPLNQNLMQQSEGNVLRDLGINEMSSAIAFTDAQTHVQKNMPTQESPLDMLDEYLVDDYTNISTQTSRNSSIQNPTTEVLGQVFRGFRDKILK